MPDPLLEVVVLSAADARAAVRGGADRLELVADMSADGLTPPAVVWAAVRDAVDVPVRVMIRRAPGFARGVPLDRLRADAAELWSAGAREFVGGWLTAAGDPDVEACAAVFGDLPDARWTFHRAFDHIPDRAAAWTVAAALPGVDTILTSGGPGGVGDGLAALTADAEAEMAAKSAAGKSAAAKTTSAKAMPAAANDRPTADSDAQPPTPRPRILVGGGLRLEHLPALEAAGLNAFHIGSPARRGGWDQPVDPAAVARWREAIG
ncbi:copper homeostasis protein CutC [Uniformispora flossi]|uniref:copper homeostasis protein CutC n=1 Tax=Uniformispora flossi TaxID=3390723 RepID=UPI003C2CE0D6